MNTKLTLSIEKDVIDKAKNYAKYSGRSLSDLVESYLISLVKKENDSADKIPEAFRDLFGAVNLPLDMDHKKEIRILWPIKENNEPVFRHMFFSIYSTISLLRP